MSALTLTPASAANLIQNGSFEIGTANPPNGSFLFLTTGSTVMTGWRVSQGTVDYKGTFWQASDGSRSVDLTGDRAGEIQQTFNTTIGKTYRVTFDMAGNPARDPIIKNMRVSAGGNSADFSFDITGKSTTNMGWITNSLDFTANSTTTTLSFLSFVNTDAGAILDNVSVEVLSSTPEPSSVLGLLGLGILGLGSVLKRKS